MSENPSSANEILDEELIAYLDGELPSEQARRLERRLADEPELRTRLHELQTTWEMLDALPKARPSLAFTTSTLSMVAVTAEQEVTKAEWATNLTSMAWWVGGGALAAAAALVAFVMTQSHLQAPNRELAHDLPVIERLDQYRYVDNLDFLQQLDEEGLFVPEEGDAL
jgi:anti-sigma factor RsiW